MTLHPDTPASQPAATRLALGVHLAVRRGLARVPRKEAAARIGQKVSTIRQYEEGTAAIPEHEVCSLMSLYDQPDIAIRDALILQRQGEEDEYQDTGYGARTRVRALEQHAARITVCTSWVIPPVLYSEPYADYQSKVGAATVWRPRPRPSCPVTLLVEHSVLQRPIGGHAVLAAQLFYWIGLALTGSIELRVVPFGEAIAFSGVISEIDLRQGSRIWIDDAPAPTYSTGVAGARRGVLIQRARDGALSPEDSLQVVRAAADHHQAAVRAKSSAEGCGPAPGPIRFG